MVLLYYQAISSLAALSGNSIRLYIKFRFFKIMFTNKVLDVFVRACF